MKENIVPTTAYYNSAILENNLRTLMRVYPFLNVQTVGFSVLGRPIKVVRLGRGNKHIFYSASYHANEWITSVILMKFIEDYSKAYVSNEKLFNYNIKNLFATTSIYIMPMVNPDGVDLVTGYFSPNSQIYRSFENIAKAKPSIPFPSGWKANFNGVDLNLQFPAGWEQAKEIKYSQGFTGPSPRDFVGYGPLTEPESLAVYNFTLSHNFHLAIAWHTQGEEIYWQFQNFNPANSYYIGNRLASASGYRLANTPYNSSFAGFKDWFIQNYNKPGYTIEAGLGQNPLPISDFPKIYQDNLGILILGAVL